MTSLTNVLELTGGAARTGNGLRIEPTYWGYILPGEGFRRAGGATLRAVVKFTGVCLVLASVGFLALPGSYLGSDVLPIKLAISAFFLFCGVVALQFGRDAGKPEVQVDLHRKEIRMVTRRGDGRCHLDHMYAFTDVNEVEAEDGALLLLGPDAEEIAKIDISGRGAFVLRPDLRSTRRTSRPLSAR